MKGVALLFTRSAQTPKNIPLQVIAQLLMGGSMRIAKRNQRKKPEYFNSQAPIGLAMKKKKESLPG